MCLYSPGGGDITSSCANWFAVDALSCASRSSACSGYCQRATSLTHPWGGRYPLLELLVRDVVSGAAAAHAYVRRHYLVALWWIGAFVRV